MEKENSLPLGEMSAGQRGKIQQEIITLLKLETLYRAHAKQTISKLRKTITRRKELENLIKPKSN